MPHRAASRIDIAGLVGLDGCPWTRVVYAVVLIVVGLSAVVTAIGFAA